ncbi:hypothetical protein [Aliivibrio kagoshimensis]|uniref:hypothetical protein n=1 Tax=Aliivibrio kagoshimensis TaxID=2910230 RepID=UPI003D0AA101
MGDAKGFAEAESGFDYLLAGVGVVPLAGDLIKKAAKAFDAGDIELAQDLLIQAKKELTNNPKLLDYQPTNSNTQLTGGTDKSVGDLANAPPKHTDLGNGKVEGPRGGISDYTGIKDKDGNLVYEREKGGYFTVDPISGKQTSITTPDELRQLGSLQEFRQVHQKAVDDISNVFSNSGHKFNPEVTLQAGDINSTRARADGILSGGEHNGIIETPEGFQAFDLNGNMLDNIPLDSKGRAIVEVKTGKASCSSNQSCVYSEAILGNAVGKGENAVTAGLKHNTPAPDSVVILRKL